MLNFYSHLTLLLNMNAGHTSSCYKHNRNKKIVLKSWVQIQLYTAVDFQGRSKMTLTIKWPISPFLRSEFQKNF